jgi:uncharacterized SAM-binding protein YcdF (DUF218 family)
MEQDKIINISMNPQAIIILTGGTIMDQNGEYHSTSYSDGDAFGTLGGYARVEAASILALKYPDALLVTTGMGSGDGVAPSHAKVMENELIALGIPERRIILEEKSTNSKSGLLEILILAERYRWERIIVISSEYHVPRVHAMWEMINSSVKADFIAAEDILQSSQPEFGKIFEELKKTPAYIKRLESEAHGLKALRSGTYESAKTEDKKERLV